jgi:sodium transport system permease protein
MLRQTLVITRKEILDHLREVRSLWASLMHLLMGPVVVSLVLFSMKNTAHSKVVPVISSMAAIFLSVSTFTGGMNVSMDMLAGERERRSLLPLLLNPVSRTSVILGKWLAISMFAACGAILTFGAFAVAFTTAGIPLPHFWRVALALLPLAALAAALQLTISTFCRTVKEAQTYLSLLIFVPMGIAMFTVFIVPNPSPWMLCIPIIGQQVLLTGATHLPIVTPTLTLVTVWFTALALQYSASLLGRDEIVYGR